MASDQEPGIPLTRLATTASPRTLRSPPTVSPRTPFHGPRSPGNAPTSTRIAFDAPTRPVTPDELDLGAPMIDADDFLAPPALDPVVHSSDEQQGFRLPRVPTLEPARKAAIAARRKAKRRALSTSSRASVGAKGRLRSLGRRISHASAFSGESETSSSSSSSNASSLSRSRWRFWRNDSSDSESETDTDDSYIPPEPSYELVLPSLSVQATAQPFASYSAPTLAAALEKLEIFWAERRQTEHAGGDLAGESKTSTMPPAHVHGAAIDRPGGNGAGWWLDIQSPSISDMRLLRKHLPLHPLTIEDILHQDLREKVERFDKLRYTLIAFRAIDDSYFRWHTVDSNSDSSSGSSDSKGSPDKPFSTADEKISIEPSLPEYDTERIKEHRRHRLEICEGVGGKEGLEGVGVGAINLYLVVFRDGIVSFHYEPLPKHMGRVYNKIQQYGISRPINSYWIAYNLLDSIVDAFFPIVDYIEHEATEINDYLSDPIALHDVESFAKQRKPSKLKRTLTKLTEQETITVPRWLSYLPPWLVFMPKPVRNGPIEMKQVGGTEMPLPANAKQMLGQEFRKDGRLLLRKMTDTRKLVTAMSRLLTPKTDVMRGMRKRISELPNASERDINIYFGDLQDHIVALHQSLVWYESVLSHDHPAFTSILRLGLERAKMGTDYNILRFYIVVLIVIPGQIVTNAFGMNVLVPHNGLYKQAMEADGSRPPFTWFGIIVGIAGLIFVVVSLCGWLVLRKLKRPPTAVPFK